MANRKFTWCRKEVAEQCDQAHDHVHIIIASPGAKGRIMPPCKETALRLFFHDLDPDEIRRTNAFSKDPQRGEEIIASCFTEEHAGQIELFVHATNPSDVIVNCEAGVSRSPGVVLALRRKYGGDVEQVYAKAYPNIYVANVLGRQLGVGPFEAVKYTGIIDPFTKD